MVAELSPERHAESRQAPQKIEVNGEIVEYHSEYLDMLPPSITKVQEKRAVPYLIDTLMASEGDITLIPVGPLDVYKRQLLCISHFLRWVRVQWRCSFQLWKTKRRVSTKKKDLI